MMKTLHEAAGCRHVAFGVDCAHPHGPRSRVPARGVVNAAARALVLIAASLLGAFGHAAFAAALDGESVERVIAVDRHTDKTRAERLVAIRAAFSDLQPSYQELLGDLSGASQDELKSLWRLSSFMAYATNDRQFATDMELAQEEYTRRNLTPPQELQERLLESLIGFREFDQARTYAIKAGLPIEHIPRVEGVARKSGKGLTVLKVDVGRGVLLREPVNLDGGDVHVFVVSFIGCAFSRHAADAIENHEVLRGLMREKSTWIVQPGLLYFNDVLAWNRIHPSTGFSYVDSMESWGFIDDWATPTFYFVQSGRVVSKLKGWSDDAAGISALLKGMGVNGAP